MIIIANFLPECLSSESLNQSKLCFSSLRFTQITVGFWNLLDLRNSGFIKQSITGLKTGVAPCAKRAYRAELGFFPWVKKYAVYGISMAPISGIPMAMVMAIFTGTAPHVGVSNLELGYPLSGTSKCTTPCGCPRVSVSWIHKWVA